MLLLTASLVATRDGRTEDTAAYLTEARELAAHIGERNHMRFHFGLTNVAAWELGLAVESGAAQTQPSGSSLPRSTFRSSPAGNARPM